jgi:hypothetical protein
MELSQANLLLEPGYLPMESGYQRLADGQLHVAARTSMPGCRSEMIDWWFGYVRTTEQYKRWHPTDHVWCDWDGLDGEYIGGTHLVHEYIGGNLNKLKIHFRPAEEYLDVSRFEQADVGTAVCARTGSLETDLWAGHLIHLVRDTDYGCEMRSRFWLGDFEPNIAETPERLSELIPDVVGWGLLKHCNEEMGFLAGFLPDLYRAETQ